MGLLVLLAFQQLTIGSIPRVLPDGGVAAGDGGCDGAGVVVGVLLAVEVRRGKAFWRLQGKSFLMKQREKMGGCGWGIERRLLLRLF